MFYCPQCEADVSLEDLHQNEGVCAECCRENQARLDLHNARVEWWDKLTPAEREAKIRTAMRLAS